MTAPSPAQAAVDASTEAPRGLNVNLIGIDNGAGLSVDAELILGALRSTGARANWSTRGPSLAAMGLNRIVGRRWPATRFDVNVFLERCHVSWFPFASRNVLVPNPEWFPAEQTPLLSHLDEVLCKTRDAQNIFQSLGRSTRWIGFTARDRWDGHLAATAARRVLHLAGRSEHKGTSRVLALWERHPEWPVLMVVRRPLDADTTLELPPLPNVRYLTHRLSDAEIVTLQREHAVHLLPSEVEGYGQSLAEALAVGAVVVTTDAPPMNELVRPDRGVLVPATSGEVCCLGRLYHVDVNAMEATLTDLFGWTAERYRSLGEAARRWFRENDERFRYDFPRVLHALASAKGVH